MNGKNFFRACCNQMGIHCDTRFKLGAQNSKTAEAMSITAHRS